MAKNNIMKDAFPEKKNKKLLIIALVFTILEISICPLILLLSSGDWFLVAFIAYGVFQLLLPCIMNLFMIKNGEQGDNRWHRFSIYMISLCTSSFFGHLWIYLYLDGSPFKMHNLIFVFFVSAYVAIGTVTYFIIDLIDRTCKKSKNKRTNHI